MVRKKTLDNKGSALVTVMVVVTFVTILATLLLFVATTNYQMKQVDYGNKKNFYAGEEVLDRLKAALIAQVAAAYSEAYDTTIVEYAKYSNPDGFSPAERIAVYNREFVCEFRELFAERAGAENDRLKALRSLLPEEYADAVVGVEDIAYVENAGYIYLTGVRVSYTDDKNYTTQIVTDIYVEAPSYTGEEVLVTKMNSVTFVNWEKQ
ncbi:MAG: hypothetical protein E7287_07100 [Lachnospiraceae bacterium]|nr:hypothetical protein [Lachnospiraceae bacterium]